MRIIYGFRVDAVPYLVEREGTSCENLPETQAVMRELRRRMEAEFPGRVLLAEANMWPEEVRPYFGEGDEFQMAFHFPLMPRMFMALRLEDRKPLVEIVERTTEIPAACQWGLFLPPTRSRRPPGHRRVTTDGGFVPDGSFLAQPDWDRTLFMTLYLAA